MSKPRSKGVGPKKRPYDVGHYRIELDIDETTDRFTGKVGITLTPSAAIDEVTFDCVGLHVVQVTQTSAHRAAALPFTVRADPAHPDDGTLTLSLAGALPKGRPSTFEVEYEGRATPEQAGLFWVSDPDDPGRGHIYATQFEAVSARRLFPSNDEPYDRATTEMIVTVAPDFDVVSNGREVANETVERDGRTRKRSHWVMDKSQAPYLVALAAGRFARADVPGTKLGFYLDPRKVDRAEYLKRSTEHAMRFQEEFLGVTYPWDRYLQVSIPTFRWGGMENTGCTLEKASAILPDDPSSERIKIRLQGLVAHELAHQWFGDYVTMHWWDDLWLNESFASYMQQLTSEDFFADEFDTIYELVHTHTEYFRQEGGPLAHPIVQNELPSPEDAFDPITYTKGQNVLRLLDTYIGRKAFRKGINSYLTDFALGNATTADFFAAMQKASGRNLAPFRKAWLYHRGYPVLNVGTVFDRKRGAARLVVKQRPLMRDGAVFPFRLPVALHRRTAPAYDIETDIDVGTVSAFRDVKVPAQPEWVTWNTKAVVLTRIEKRDDGEEGWATQARHDPDPVSRFAALVELAAPVMDRSRGEPGKLSSTGATTIDWVLRNDPSAYVRAGFIELLSSMPWRRLPAALAGAVVSCVSAPPPGATPHGAAWLRGAALASLGKFGTSEARAAATHALSESSLPLDDLGPAARGMAQFGDEPAFQALDAAHRLHGQRGYAYRVAVAIGTCGASSEAAVPRIRKMFEEAGSDADQLLKLERQLADNTLVLGTSEGAQLARDLTRWAAASESFRAEAVGLFEEVKTPAAKRELRLIAKGAATDRLRQLAQRILDKNFGRRG